MARYQEDFSQTLDKLFLLCLQLQFCLFSLFIFIFIFANSQVSYYHCHLQTVVMDFLSRYTKDNRDTAMNSVLRTPFVICIFNF